jgi:hypothetical protein
MYNKLLGGGGGTAKGQVSFFYSSIVIEVAKGMNNSYILQLKTYLLYFVMDNTNFVYAFLIHMGC